MFNFSSGLMSLGLLPLLFGVLVKVDPYIVGWLIGTYPLIVIAFISGMQFQADRSYLIQGISVFLPVICSLLILVYAHAYMIYMLALMLCLCIDMALYYKKTFSIDYLRLRLVLTLLFMVLLWELNQ